MPRTYRQVQKWISAGSVKVLFAVVENHRVGRCGRKEKFPEGSAIAEILRDEILCDAEH